MSQRPHGGESTPSGPEIAATPSPYAPPSAHVPGGGAPQPAPAPWWAQDGGSPSTPQPGATPAPAGPAPRAQRTRPLWRTVGLVAAGLAAGVVLVGALQPGNASTTATTTAAANRDDTTADPGTTGRETVPRGALPERNGEERVLGTIRAVTSSSVTVRSTSGTATYEVDANTDVREDGAQVAITSLSVGEQVLLHVIPGTQSDYAERVLAGTSVQERRGRTGPPSGGPAATT